MKKRILLAAAAACVACCCFTACNSVSYDDLNSKLKLDYSTVTLTITDNFDEGVSLVSKYDMVFSADSVTLTYSIERFAGISLNNPSEDIKTIWTGEAVIKDGELVSGDIGNIGGSHLMSDGLDFKAEYFENAKLTDSSFEADVKDVAGFLDAQFSCTDMKVSASFGESFNSITVTYKAESGNLVEYLYEFGALA